MPRNQISGLSVCLECPEIRFPVSPCVWNARKSDLRICRTTSLSEHDVDGGARREVGVKLVADLGDFDLLGLFGFFLVKREKRVVADVVDTQQELAANKEMIGHGVRKIGADACGDVVERV